MFEIGDEVRLKIEAKYIETCKFNGCIVTIVDIDSSPLPYTVRNNTNHSFRVFEFEMEHVEELFVFPCGDEPAENYPRRWTHTIKLDLDDEDIKRIINNIRAEFEKPQGGFVPCH